VTGQRYSTFLLDLDHTLFDSDASELAAFSQAMTLAGITALAGHADAFRRINLELWAAVERGELTPQTVKTRRFERLVEEAGLVTDHVAMAEAYALGLAENGGLYRGACEVLDTLQQHAKVALVTNGLSEVQRRRIERTGLGRYLDAVVISAEVGIAKPAREIFDIAIRQLGSPPKESVVMVGDNLASDMRGGASYGIATCWFNPKGVKADPADRISHEIGALEELLRYVDAGTGGPGRTE
jgi:YjjG family noncanonical pyrimidine nucleotidase